jgi:hypothetical protein
MFSLTASYAPPPPPGASPPVQWGDEAIVRERLGAAVRDIAFAHDTMVAPALSVAHSRLAFERTAGPVVKLVQMLSASDPAKLEKFRREYEALTSEYYADNAVRQKFLMTRAQKR